MLHCNVNTQHKKIAMQPANDPCTSDPKLTSTDEESIVQIMISDIAKSLEVMSGLLTEMKKDSHTDQQKVESFVSFIKLSLERMDSLLDSGLYKGKQAYLRDIYNYIQKKRSEQMVAYPTLIERHAKNLLKKANRRDMPTNNPNELGLFKWGYYRERYVGRTPNSIIILKKTGTERRCANANCTFHNVPTSDLQHCSRCCTTFCSVECEKAEWKSNNSVHKKFCNVNAVRCALEKHLVDKGELEHISAPQEPGKNMVGIKLDWNVFIKKDGVQDLISRRRNALEDMQAEEFKSFNDMYQSMVPSDYLDSLVSKTLENGLDRLMASIIDRR